VLEGNALHVPFAAVHMHVLSLQAAGGKDVILTSAAEGWCCRVPHFACHTNDTNT
jgi:hypothetical protein